MSDIKLVSKEYAESVFVTGQQVGRIISEHSEFVTGPQLQTELSKKQDNVGLYIGDDGNLTTGTGITQIGMPYENHFEGLTHFTDVKINDQKPVLDVMSSDDSVTITRTSNGYGVDLMTNGAGSKWITDGIDQGSTYLSLGRDENDLTVNSIFICGPMYHKNYAAGIQFIGSWQHGGILMNVSGSGVTTDSGLILEDGDNGSRLALSPYLCIYYEGPCIGCDNTSYDGSLALVGGKGAGVKIVARDSSGNEKYAYIDYDNIDKLINLLNS